MTFICYVATHFSSLLLHICTHIPGPLVMHLWHFREGKEKKKKTACFQVWRKVQQQRLSSDSSPDSSPAEQRGFCGPHIWETSYGSPSSSNPKALALLEAPSSGREGRKKKKKKTRITSLWIKMRSHWASKLTIFHQSSLWLSWTHTRCCVWCWK